MRVLAAWVLLLSSVLLVGACSAVILGPTQGWATYRISVGGQRTPAELLTLNETVAPASQSGFVQLTIDVISNVRNFTYSNIVNSSSFPEIFPYLVGINNQSISYSTSGIEATVHIHNSGNTQVAFQGSTYTGTVYQVSVSANYSPMALALSGNGTIITLPSGLIYSVQLEQVSGYATNAQLLRTSLPVAVATGASLPVGLAILTIGLLAAIAFAVPSIFIRLRRKPNAEPAPPPQPQAEEKPSYWVD